VLFGQGGIAVEALDDSTLELPPLNDTLARAQIARTRVWKLLQGVRGRKPADIGAIADTLVRISRLVSDHAEIRELDINPLLADADGVLALDARVRVVATTQPAAARLAISPYPRELESAATLPEGTVIRIRPVRPEDASLLRDLLGAAAPRVAQVDYDRAMVLLALAPDASLLGLARYRADPDLSRAHYTLAVSPAATGRGVEAVLLERLHEAARQRGIAALRPREEP